ncbi:uncharacterized protein METZ01_LOCUS198965 [marine metagenome]|uniref:Uncharacterized protein n=1 Tax=marine metagenome TaxID=408172 RepID=A0A382E7Y9_9ZZZZ
MRSLTVCVHAQDVEQFQFSDNK